MFERWVKTYEKILDWEWSADPYVFTFFVKLTLLVNVSTKRWHGRTIKRGQLLTSIRHLSATMQMDEKTVQRLIKSLCETGEITTETDKNGTLITLVNFGKYQGEGVGINPTPAPTPAPTNSRIEECKKKEEKNINPLPHARAREIGIEAFGSFANVFLYPAEHRTLSETYGQELTAKAVDDLSCKIAEGDEQALNSRNHYATLDRWLRYKRETAKVPMTSTSADSMSEREKILRIAWDATSEEGRKEYLDDHEGLLPWDYERKHQQP